MKNVLSWSKAAGWLILSVLLATSIVKLPVPRALDGDFVFEEDFQSYGYRNLTTTTADWDIFGGTLEAEQHKALFWQFNPAAALGSDGDGQALQTICRCHSAQPRRL